jgi:very-short-patch-repair endonuclease
MGTEERIAQMHAAAAIALKQRIECFEAACESPMEKLFLAGMYASGLFLPEMDSPERWPGPVGVARTGKHVACSDVAGLPMVVHAQKQIRVGKKTYRVDFAVWYERARVVVEVDGHDFHERTKEQAAADKSRDRALVSAGWKVLRFAGSEVYADPIACATQVYECVSACIWETGT